VPGYALPTAAAPGFAPSSRSSNLAVVGAVLLLLAAGALLTPRGAGDTTGLSLLGVPLPTICWFRLTTGMPCPGCGMTRAIALLMHGRLGSSLAINPFGAVAVGLALLQIPPRAVRGAGAVPAWTFRYDRVWACALVAAVVLMLVWWTLRVGARAWLGA
jgi:hypothetical protein